MRNCSQFVSVLVLVLGSIFIPVNTQGQEQKPKSVETRVETKQITPAVEYHFSRNIGRGRLVKSQDGKPGEIRRTFQIIRKNGKPVAKKLIKEEKVAAEPTIFLMGKSGYSSSRGSYTRSRKVVMNATGYHAMVTGTGRTAMGLRAGYGHVAVDPRVIPLGSRVYVEGYGFAIASDTGGAIKGNKIDLCYPDYASAMRFGRRKVTVHVFKSR